MEIKLVKNTFYNEKETRAKLAEFVANAEFLSMGKETKKFEEAFAEKQGRKFAVMVTSGSAANLLLLQALKNIGKLKDGDKIGVSAITWATNVFPVIQLGMNPVFVDSEIDTLNVSPKKLSEKLSGMKAFFLTNVLGFSDDIGLIAKICKEGGILFFEDNCESLGSKVQGRHLGNFGEAATFSFFVAHHISTVEGGMVVTDDENLYHELLLARSHGWDRNLPHTKQKEIRLANNLDDFFSKYAFHRLAYNVRPTDIQGFIGLDQIQYWDNIVQKRASNFERFNEAATKNPDLIPIKTSHMDIVSNFAMPVISRDKEKFIFYKKRFEDGGVEVRPIIAGNISKHPYWIDIKKSEHLEGADFIHQNGFYFANNPDLTEEEIQYLIDLLKK